MMFGFGRPKPAPRPEPQISTGKSKVTMSVPKTAAWIVVAIPLVAGFEGLYTHMYRDSVGVPTICYGATAADHVDLSRTYTPQECRDMLGRDLPKYDDQIKKCITPATYAALPPHRHAALVSFTYNLGGGAFCHSSIPRYLNAGNVAAGCHAFLAYDHAGGRVLKGLTTRRQAEYKLCMMDN